MAGWVNAGGPPRAEGQGKHRGPMGAGAAGPGEGAGGHPGQKVDCQKITCKPMCKPSVILLKLYNLYTFYKKPKVCT